MTEEIDPRQTRQGNKTQYRRQKDKTTRHNKQDADVNNDTA